MANYPKDIKDRDLCDTCYPNIGVNPDSTYVLTNLKKCKPCPTPCSSCEKENKDLSNLVVCKSCPVIG